jgi:integrase/recombinase XerD
MTETTQLPLFTTVGQVSLSRNTSLAQAIEPFQIYLRNEGKTDNTIKGFTSDLHLMCQFFGDDVLIGSLSTKDLNRFLDWLEHGRGQPCSRKSYARRVTTIKVFFKWLKEERIRTDNPAKAVVQRSGPAPLQPILSPTEIHRLLDYTHQLRFAQKPDARPNLLVWLLLDTGIKKSECMNLTLQSIDMRNPEHPVLNIRHRERHNLYKERRIPLNPEWLVVLEEYQRQYKPTNVIFECTARNLEYVLHDVAVAAGVDGKVSFEILRWTSAVQAYLNGMDMEALREKMGLSRISWRETSAKITKLAQHHP